MNTTLSTKLAALLLALAANGVIMGGVALVFTAGTAQVTSLNVAANASARLDRRAV